MIVIYHYDKFTIDLVSHKRRNLIQVRLKSRCAGYGSRYRHLRSYCILLRVVCPTAAQTLTTICHSKLCIHN